MAYLLVDDDADFADSVATVCRAMGHEAKVVFKPVETLPCVAECRPDAVILDVIFPEDPAAGFQVARDLRKRAPRPAHPHAHCPQPAVSLGFESPRH